MIKIYKNHSLYSHTYTKQNIIVKYYIEFDNIKILKPLLNFFKKVFFVGNCSKLLFCFKSKDICLIKYTKDEIKIINNLLIVDSGVSLFQLGEYAISNEIDGFEKIMTIPGLVGGSVYNNASCFNQVISDYILFVEAYDLKNYKKIILNKNDCEFGYRTSIFHNKQYLILRVYFKIKKSFKHLLIDNFYEVIRLRNLYQPKGISYGSTFKNHNKYKARELIKSLSITDSYEKVHLSKINSNFIILDLNFDYIYIVKLIERINELLYNKHGITLESEINIIY